MPSPFPGMDPYLENPALWPDFHARFITIASDFLAERLRPRYVVGIEERVYLSDEGGPGRVLRVPDLQVSARARGGERPFAGGGGGGAVAVEDLIEPVVATTKVRHPDAVRETRLEVIDLGGRS